MGTVVEPQLEHIQSTDRYGEVAPYGARESGEVQLFPFMSRSFTERNHEKRILYAVHDREVQSMQ